MTTTNIVSTPNIEGNIGSCEIKSTNYSVDYWHTETVAINSCNGDIVARNTVFDSSGFLWIPVILIVIGFVWIVSDRY